MSGIYPVLMGIVLCICFSAFCSAAEMSFSSCNLLRLENAREEGNKKAAVAVRILDRYDDALSAILIGNNLANIGGSSLASVAVILLTGGDEYTWAATVILTVLVIVFGETMPKITAKKNATRLATSFAYPVRLLIFVLTPLVKLVVLLINVISFPFKGEQSSEDEAVEELQSIIETAEDEEVLDEEQSELIQAAIDFSEISVSEVMTARVDVEAIDIDDDWENILAILEGDSFSRLPVYEGSIDNIIGILYLNHFLKAVVDGERVDIRKLLMPPCYVYKTVKLPAVLSQLRKAKQHLAVVSDEFGGTLGVVTMEDVLEQIVGEIWDESDEVEEEVVRHNESEFELDGAMTISDFTELMGIREEDFDYESETVGGWTLEMFGDFPRERDSFCFGQFVVTVLSMDGRRVERVLVKRSEEKTEE